MASTFTANVVSMPSPVDRFALVTCRPALPTKPFNGGSAPLPRRPMISPAAARTDAIDDSSASTQLTLRFPLSRPSWATSSSPLPRVVTTRCRSASSRSMRTAAKLPIPRLAPVMTIVCFMVAPSSGGYAALA